MTPQPTCVFDECFIETGDGGRLRVRSVRLGVPVRAEVLVTHGLGEHASRYGHLAAAFAERGVRLHAYDLRGHGRSSGRRGDAARYDLLLDDLRMMHGRVGKSGHPVFLFGHSLGGQITLRFLDRDEPALAGAVVASPWLRLAFEPPRWRLALARLALRLWPRFTQGTGMRPENLSRDRAHVGTIAEPELVHHSISARMFFAVCEAGEMALARAERVRVPLLLVHGDADPVTSWRATRDFHARAGSRDKTLKIYPDAVHETHNDVHREQVIRDVADWIEARL